MYDTLVRRVLELAATQPDMPAVAFKKELLSYRQLADRMRSAGEYLHSLGVQKGDRVVFSALSKPEMVVTYLGIQYCGAVAVFLDKNGTPENAAAIYEDAEAVLLLTDKPMKEYAQRCRIFSLKQLYEISAHTEEASLQYQLPSEDELAELLFTTGSTGKPKGVMLTYKAVYHILANTIEGIGIRGDDRVLLPLPLNHSFALRVLRAVLYAGGMVVLQNGFAFAKEVENNQAAFGCTAMAAVSASMEILRGQMQDRFPEILGKFRYIEISAGSLTLEQRRRLTRQLPDTVIHNTWGSTETGGALFLNVTEAAKNGEKIAAVGKPLDCVQVKVLDEEGNEIASDKSHAGRMALKGDMQMAGYWHRDELNRETLRDGWLLTGDLVYTDQDGYVYMLGRADDIINVGGEKVSPIEVENLAGQYEHVRECACIGVEDPKKVMGQVPVLFVTVRGNGFTEAGMQSFLAERMERYKVPAYYMVVQEIPRNRMQKVDRKALKLLWENRGQQDLMNPVMQTIFTRRSIRKFTEKTIPKEILDMIVQAGYYAPTGHNMQTWRFTVLTSRESIAKLKDLTVATARENKVYCYGFENPACIILITNDRRNQYGCQDASCAAENIFLAAASYGIGSVWLNPLMKLRDAEPVKSLLDSYGIPENHTVWCMAALGYPVAEGTMLAKKKDVVHYVDEEA